MSKEQFSYFLPPIWRKSKPQTLSLEEVWRYVSGKDVLQIQRIDKEDRPYQIGTLQEETERLRRMSPEEYNDKVKGKVSYLPLCTFGGVFSQREIEGLQETSGLINLDIDHISRLEGLSLEDLKERISQDREIGVRLVFTSPSGDGLKIVCKTSREITDRKSYDLEFRILNQFVSYKYGIPIGSIGLDKGISDISRGCLLCYDPGAILRDWEDTFKPDPQKLPQPKKEKRKPQRASGEYFSPWEWDNFIEERLIPEIYDNLSIFFPGMDFIYTGKSWISPYKLDGTNPKTPRRDKTVVTARVPGLILEQGGEAVSIIDYYADLNGLSYTEARKQLSLLCGLETEERELSRRYAQMKEKENNYMDKRPITREERSFPNQTPTVEAPEVRYQEYREVKPLKEIASTKREGIKTGYQFKDSQEREEPLVIPSGALTLICGKSSHGKSRLLQNLSLQIATEEYNKGGDGVVLYFSFEEALLEVVERFGNIQINIPSLSQYGTSNTEVIRDYFQTGTFNKAPKETRVEALQKIKGFESLYTEGKLRVYYTPDLLSGDLCSLLEWLSSQMKIKAVFLDYVQAIYRENNRKDRREELREICKELNKTAISLEIPIVLSAQLNRETPNPTEMSGDNIAESADITRYANTILLLWDSAKGRDIRGGLSGYLNTKEGKELQDRGFNLGTPGKLYAILSKNRGGTPNVEALLDYVPETGRITENEDLPSGIGGSQEQIEFD